MEDKTPIVCLNCGLLEMIFRLDRTHCILTDLFTVLRRLIQWYRYLRRRCFRVASHMTPPMTLAGC